MEISEKMPIPEEVKAAFLYFRIYRQTVIPKKVYILQIGYINPVD